MESDKRGQHVFVGIAFVVVLGAAVAGSVVMWSRGGGKARGPVAGAPPGSSVASADSAELAALGDGAAIREPVVAGRFYAGDSAALAADVDGYLAAAAERPLPGLRALVVPHAGYRYSGPTAGVGFRQVRGRAYRTVYVLAPSHHAAFRGVHLGEYAAYRTPLGLVRVAPTARSMLGVGPFVSVPEADREEHALEVELPFLQRVLPDFSLVPLVFGGVDPARVADALAPRLDADTLVVASSDLSHYRPYDEAVAMDRATLDAVVALDGDRLGEETACGRGPIRTVIHLARRLGWRAELLDYRNSGDTAGDRSRVVGYAAVAFVEKN